MTITENKISTFFGENNCYSNFYRVELIWDNILWPSSEHAYQAAKALDRNVRLAFAGIKIVAEAKRAGKVGRFTIKRRGEPVEVTFELRPDWEHVKIDLMRDIVQCKFSQNLELKQRLLDTGDMILEEGNTWKDRFWGICPPNSGNGQNWLGRILMELRDRYRQESLTT